MPKSLQNKTTLKTLSIDIEAEIIKAEFSISREQQKPADSQHENPYTLIDNKSVIKETLTFDDYKGFITSITNKINTDYS
jgi:hypothetical protein